MFDRLVYGVHPYGRPDSGTPASIASITREDLLAFHKAWFGANNAILAIVGDVTADEAFAGAERAFGDVGEGAEQPRRAPQEPPPPTRRVVVIDRPGAVQTEIRVGNIGLPRKHPDYLALDLAIKILGGEGGNRLHRVLRSERGLTYGASADINALKDAGDIVADTDTRSETTGEALRLIVDEFWRLQRQRVSDRELADAQAYLTGSFPLTIETPSAIALQVLNAVFYGLDLERAADVPRARQRGHAGRHPARRAAVPAPRSAVDRAGRRRVGLRQAAAGRRLRSVRAHSARRSRSGVGRLPPPRDAGRPARGARSSAGAVNRSAGARSDAARRIRRRAPLPASAPQRQRVRAGSSSLAPSRPRAAPTKLRSIRTVKAAATMTVSVAGGDPVDVET